MTQVVAPPKAGTSALSRPPGPRGEQGDQGFKGWSPLLAVIEDGARRVLHITDWMGGAGAKPAAGLYIGPSGTVATPGEAMDIRGLPGLDGDDGSNGTNGWSPVYAIATDGARRVLQVADWIGGTSGKPATGVYVGAAGFVAAIANGVDIRGPQGAAGTGVTYSDTAPPNPAPAAAAGVANEASRSDHAHQFPLAAISQTLTAAGALAATDHGKVVEWNSANAALTLPNNLAAGFNCLVRVIHATGLPTFTAASGATIRQADAYTKARKQWSEVSVAVRANVGGAAAEYVLSGDMS